MIVEEANRRTMPTRAFAARVVARLSLAIVLRVVFAYVYVFCILKFSFINQLLQNEPKIHIKIVRAKCLACSENSFSLY